MTRVVGVIGLGNMGGRIARRIRAGGHDVLGYDPRPTQAEHYGIAPAATISQLAEGADVVLLSLPESKVVEAVVLDEGGVAASCRPGQTVVDLSTSAPHSTVRLHALLQEKGIEFLDAGVSGGPMGADTGELTIMVGGSRSALESVMWALEPFSARVHYMGEPGSGHTTKVLNNFLNAVTLAASAEVMVAARKAGLDLHTFLEVVNRSTGMSYATTTRFPAIVDGDYLEGGLTSRLMMKDVALYLDVAHGLGIPCINAAGPLAAFGLANQLGYGDVVSNHVVDAIGDVAGGVRLQRNSDEAPSNGSGSAKPDGTAV